MSDFMASHTPRGTRQFAKWTPAPLCGRCGITRRRGSRFGYCRDCLSVESSIARELGEGR